MKASILLGGNLGNRAAYLKFAIFHIKKDIGQVLKQSQVYETAAWGGLSDKAYLNQALVVETRLSPRQVLQKLLEIELKAGRKRTLKWGNRTLDIDILFLEDLIIEEEDLIVPHPEIQNRNFVLSCLCEIQSDFKHPKLGKTIQELLDICPDQLTAQIYKDKRV